LALRAVATPVGRRARHKCEFAKKFFRGFCHAVVTLIGDRRAGTFVARVTTASRLAIVGVATCTRLHGETFAPVDDRARSDLLGARSRVFAVQLPSLRARADVRARSCVVCVLTCTYVRPAAASDQRIVRITLLRHARRCWFER
jgi:hypothetical protein